MKTAIALMSGGLDSVTSAFYVLKNNINVKLCLFFDYSQKAYESEKKASIYFAEKLNSEFKEIKLNFLSDITFSSLVNENKKIPSLNSEDLENKKITEQSAKNVWVPNRNGLFINIAASFCDAFKIDYIVCGFNGEEAATFPDNSEDFLIAINKSLRYSSSYPTKVISPFINKNKTEIVKYALENDIELNKIHSCYKNGKNCGICESCLRFKKALKNNGIDFTNYFLN